MAVGKNAETDKEPAAAFQGSVQCAGQKVRLVPPREGLTAPKGVNLAEGVPVLQVVVPNCAACHSAAAIYELPRATA